MKQLKALFHKLSIWLNFAFSTKINRMSIYRTMYTHLLLLRTSSKNLTTSQLLEIDQIMYRLRHIFQEEQARQEWMLRLNRHYGIVTQVTKNSNGFKMIRAISTNGMNVQQYFEEVNKFSKEIDRMIKEDKEFIFDAIKKWED